MLSLDDARRMIAENLHLLPAEHVALKEARGRRLRAPLVTEEDLPGFDRSAFDGYALRTQKDPARLRVAFEVAAGGSGTRPLAPGECARIFTGAPVPEGADAVAMQEVCVRDGETVEIPAIAAGNGVRRRGEDARAGSVLVPSGVELGAVELSLFAQLGQVRPLVSPQPRVYHVRTGDEIVSPEVEPGPGQIRDSNSTLMGALVSDAGCDLAAQAVANDTLEGLMEACSGAGDAHVLLISGGASVGDYDFGRRALAEMGFSIRFTALNLRPGKPLIFATRGRQAAFVIPGNPLSHFVCWHVAIRAALDVLLSGTTALELATVRLGGDRDLPGNPRETWWPARLALRDGDAVAEPMKWLSSGDMTGLSGVKLLLRIPSGDSGVKVGQSIAALAV
jgi:molybdopterin molybdotransferase